MLITSMINRFGSCVLGLSGAEPRLDGSGAHGDHCAGAKVPLNHGHNVSESHQKAMKKASKSQIGSYWIILDPLKLRDLEDFHGFFMAFWWLKQLPGAHRRQGPHRLWRSWQAGAHADEGQGYDMLNVKRADDGRWWCLHMLFYDILKGKP